MRTISSVIIGGCILCAACGGNDTTNPAAPTTPAPSAPTVSSLAIDGVDAIRTGFSSGFIARATMSDGTTQTVTPTWTSSNAGVATIDTAGRVDGVSHGSVSLGASYQGRTASRSVSIVNNYGGRWNGTYVLRACDQSGVFAAAGWCKQLGGVGSILPVALAFSQTGNDLSQISGTLTLGTGIAGNVSGTVSADGRLNIGGSFNVTSEGVTFVFTFGGWDTRLVSNGQMGGRWAQNQTAIGIPGNAYQEVEIVTMSQTSTTTTSTRAPQSYTLSWSELFSRMR